MRISAICPARNEESHIENVIRFFLAAEPADKDLWIVDGDSDDQTLEIVQEIAREHSGIHILDNPDRIVPIALNKAVKRCSGDIVVRLDAHTEYHPGYFQQILDAFQRSGADVVGGPMRAVGTSTFQKAVAFATCHRFGIGDSAFHNPTVEGFVDSVYLGAWKRELFEHIGLFDENLVRNQDDEFHYRAKAHGFSVFLTPAIQSNYFPRNRPGTLFRQYYEYGLYKPMVLAKIRQGARIRHFVPAAFVLYLCSIPIAFLYPWWWVPGLLYLAMVCIVGMTTKAPWAVRGAMGVVFPILHLAYGTGFLVGLGKLGRLNR